ncbi:phosphoribosylanthranilate isomerase [Jeotgalibacillus sp. S-D1]|uniref:phosphoribosylanthranilate isomerase n=1 Tax=Jeotgalibacillus sp. S-D1 TaxID=2552189 RepID=UPI0010599CC6|nr:phosphoribosylanthranilate isomerase [Jeotgalibacillus sp. S-D1]TDL34851.1 phosphoribosylanthranilate isomerase [Jeotgalibacillus sp. S-D1]
MKVKICGLQEPEHVLAAVDAGADYIGFVFAPSKRRVSPRQAAALASLIPPRVKRVGVFVNPTQDELDEAILVAGLDIIQLHGEESNEFCAKQVKPVIKAFSIISKNDVMNLGNYDVLYHLVDAPGTGYRGGSGHSFDWSLIPQGNKPSHLFLAGGLSSENIKKAINEVKPYGVDVSSGVETNGVKDIQKIKTFIHLAKA